MNTERTEKFVNAIACDLEEGGFRQVSGTMLRRTLATAVSAALPLLHPAELAEPSGNSGEMAEQQGVHDALAATLGDLSVRGMIDDVPARIIGEAARKDMAAAIAATGKQQVGDVQGDARAQFEAWHCEKFKTRWQTGAPTRDMHNGAYAEKYGPAEQQVRWEAWQGGWQAALAARRPGAQVPVSTATQPGKRVSILESACGPARKFDPVAADAELASVPLVPLWELPELHPRKVAAECLTTMERARQSTKPHTANRVRLTNAIALVGRFVAQMERSERLGTAPPAQGIDLGQFWEPVMFWAAQVKHHYSSAEANKKQLEADRLLALIDQRGGEG
ncbi:MAG: hypothetical protein RR704_00775 [Stenotrophomonas sp.]